ncbi:MAG: inositol monophosphatase family protein, partial [Melioribacteraceae bacterium]|nr:inositol monophosphatase family protein [Melioribacteraceae bacterium]
MHQMREMVDYDDLRDQVVELCLDVSEFIKEQLGKVKKNDIEEKEMNSLVSFVDKTAEKSLVTGLQKILPSANFITEEDTVENKAGEWVWIVDPLDGTNNFLHQIPHFSISIALQNKG